MAHFRRNLYPRGSNRQSLPIYVGQVNALREVAGSDGHD